MLYIYDILVNFIDGNRIYDFYEWNNKDIIEHIKKIPLIKVNDNTFYDLLYSDIEVDLSLLDLIKDKTYTYQSKIKYAALFTNGYRCYAIEFNSDGKVLYRSSLLIDEEDEVINCSRKQININFKYIIKNKGINKINIKTREECRKINIIINDINKSFISKNYDKINYLYNEIYNDNNLSIKEKYNKLKNNISDNNINKLYDIISLEDKKKNAI